MRIRALLPQSVQMDKIDQTHCVVGGCCACGELLAGGPMIEETGSSVELKCRACHRYIQIRASMDEPAEGGAPGSAKKGNGHG